METKNITVDLNVKLIEDEAQFERKVAAQKEVIEFEMTKMSEMMGDLVQKWLDKLGGLMDN